MAISKEGWSRSLAAAAGLFAGMSGTAWAEESFDLDALVEAARKEPPITVYDSTGKIVDMAEAFSKKYGVKATGLKVSAAAQFEQIIREAQSGNIQGDVAMLTDTPATAAQLLPQGFLESWLPPDMADRIPAEFQNPLAVTTNANVFAYNTEAHDSCPISNIWQITDPKWEGRFAMVDPLTKPTYVDWFNQMEAYGEEALEKAYEDYYGTPLKTEEASAAAAFVKALAESGPLLTEGDDAVSEAVGVAGQEDPFFGLLSSAKFRDNADAGYVLGLCAEMSPWVGWSYTKLALVAAGTDSPNAARLFVHYVLTREGIEPQMVDGKIPTNTDIRMPDDEPSGLVAVADRVFGYNAGNALDDWDSRQDWQDFWRIHYKR